MKYLLMLIGVGVLGWTVLLTLLGQCIKDCNVNQYAIAMTMAVTVVLAYIIGSEEERRQNGS